MATSHEMILGLTTPARPLVVDQDHLDVMDLAKHVDDITVQTMEVADDEWKRRRMRDALRTLGRACKTQSRSPMDSQWTPFGVDRRDS